MSSFSIKNCKLRFCVTDLFKIDGVSMFRLNYHIPYFFVTIDQLRITVYPNN